MRYAESVKSGLLLWQKRPVDISIPDIYACSVRDALDKLPLLVLGDIDVVLGDIDVVLGDLDVRHIHTP